MVQFAISKDHSGCRGENMMMLQGKGRSRETISHPQQHFEGRNDWNRHFKDEETDVYG